MLTNLIFFLLENFTNSDRTPPYIDTYLQFFQTLEFLGKQLSDKNVTFLKCRRPLCIRSVFVVYQIPGVYNTTHSLCDKQKIYAQRRRGEKLWTITRFCFSLDRGGGGSRTKWKHRNEDNDNFPPLILVWSCGHNERLQRFSIPTSEGVVCRFLFSTPEDAKQVPGIRFTLSPGIGCIPHPLWFRAS